LFRNNENTPGQAQRQIDVKMVPLESLVSNPKQPRKYFASDALEELAASIRSQGLVQPLLVRQIAEGRYEIVAGERRWRGAKLAGLTEIPVLVRPLSDMEVMAAALIENLQREDLNPLEAARAMASLRAQFGLSQDALATTLGKSRPAIANALRLLNLSSEAQEALEQGHISAGHARAVLSLGSLDAQSELVRRCIQEGLSVRDAEEAASLWKEEGVFPWLHIEEDDQPGAQEQEQQTAMQSAPSERRPSRRKTHDPFLLRVQKRLRANLSIRANISGTEARGRISFNYQSREELYTLLHRLGLTNPDAIGD
jgi:ParB family chromosome partitioning protein